MDLDRFINLQRRKALVINVSVLGMLGWLILATASVLDGKYPFNQNYIIESPLTIRVTFFFLLLIASFVLLKGSWQLLSISIRRYTTKIQGGYKFVAKHFPDKWIFNGNVHLTKDNYLYIKVCRAGCLLKDYYWKNFRMSFEMKFEETDGFRTQKVIGIIFRAQDLDNYFAIEIGESFYGRQIIRNEDILCEECKKNVGTIRVSGIKPLVRYRGGWDIMQIKEVKQLLFHEFKKVDLIVSDNTADLSVDGKIRFTWTLPTHVDVNHFESGVDGRNIDEEDSNSVLISGLGHVKEIPFKSASGLIGFRAHIKHGAIIRNLRVVQI